MATEMKHARHNGFTTLAVTLLLLSILVAVSAFIGKVLIADKRLTLNEIEYRVAMAAAEKGIAEAMALLKIDTALRGEVIHNSPVLASSGQGGYSVSIDEHTTYTLEISANAVLNSGGEAVVSVQVARTSIIEPGGEFAPLVVAGNLPLNGNITIVANPNGGGKLLDEYGNKVGGNPISVWSKGEVEIANNALLTCGLHEYNYFGCDAGNSYSYKQGSEVKKGDDIVDNASDFPDDLVAYVLGIQDTSEGWAALESMATSVVDNCNDSALGGGGFFIVKNSANCSVGSLGSKDNPVLLIVKDGDLTINGNSDFYGMVFAYDSNPGSSPNYDVKINGGARVFGVVAVNHDNIDLPNGNFSVVYDYDVLCKLQGYCDGVEIDGSPFVTYKYVPGSWRDWTD
jgi:hypothetical protein